jgi:AmmeMemoRadiSam system protein A
MTSDTDRVLLLRLARETIAAHVTGTRAPSPDLDGVFGRRGAAFVTLHAHGDLRGCIGHLDGDDPLGRVVPSCAVAACSRDPRFPAVLEAELPAIEIELSLLGPFETVSGTVDVEIGRHGLVVELGWCRGLLLPQVAVEWRWDADTFFAHTCRKAGLPRDAWKNGAKVWKFEAEVFSEAGQAG